MVPVPLGRGAPKPGTGARSLTAFGVWLALVALAGWTCIVRPDLFGLRGTVELQPAAFVIFCALGLIATQLGVTVFASVSITLDTAFFTAAVFCIGPVWGSRAIACCSMWQGIWAWYERERLGRRGGLKLPLGINLLRVAYMPALGAGLAVALGALLGVEGRIADRDEGTLATALGVSSLAFAYLVLHYAAQTTAFWLQGYDARNLVRRVMAPGALTEAALVPIAVVLVLVYPAGHEHLWTFALLAGTYLLLNLFFRRVTLARDRLAARVAELEALSVVARKVSATLNVADLVPRLRTAMFDLIAPAERLRLGQVDPGSTEIVVERFDRAGRSLERDKVVVGVGPEGVLVASKLPLRIGDLATAPAPIAMRSRRGAYLGFPLLAFDEVIGLLAVESDRKGVFTEDHHRIGFALAAQAAVAMENANLYELATVDGLTGLFVRRYFDRRVDEEIARGQRHSTVFSVIMMDLDDFSAVNNRYGHPAGDAVLRQIARVIRADTRAIDIPARFGGEEFAVILPGTPVDEALIVAKRMCLHIRNNVVRFEDQEIVVSASVGVTAYLPGSDQKATDVIAQADEMMYVGKRAGKDQVVVARDTGPECHPARTSVV